MTTLLLPYPISANVYWRTKVVKGQAITYVSDEAKDYKRSVWILALKAGHRGVLTSWVGMDITLHPIAPSDALKRAQKAGPLWHLLCRCVDLDNALKVTIDSLQGIAYENDNQVVALKVARGLPIKDGGVTVSFRGITAEDFNEHGEHRND